MTLLNTLISEFDAALRTLIPPKARSAKRTNPANELARVDLNTQEQKRVAGLMRVNHAGEVCAQALYRGQALSSKTLHIRAQMAQAAEEEVDHLAWCEQRLQELNSQPSILNPLWYTGSFIIGTLAGFAGEHLGLGFVKETEEQVSAHLQNHLEELPLKDIRTKAILEQMVEDESQHADMAQKAGAAEFPVVMKKTMSFVAKFMTRSSYYI